MDEQYLRLAADFENYKKRMRAEMHQAIAFGNEKILLEIADVLDAMARAQGEYDMSILLQQILKKHGVVRIETNKRPFDPAQMEAVGTAEGDERQLVKEEVRAGYLMHGRVIRPARVIIYQ